MIVGRMFRSLFVLILIVLLGSYLFYLRTGSFPFDPTTFSRAGLGSEKADSVVDLRRLSEMPSLNSVEPSDDMKTIQKWQDENGKWNFSNQEK